MCMVIIIVAVDIIIVITLFIILKIYCSSVSFSNSYCCFNGMTMAFPRGRSSDIPSSW